MGKIQYYEAFVAFFNDDLAALGLTYRDVEQVSGIPRSTVCDITGGLRPRHATLKKVVNCKALSDETRLFASTLLRWNEILVRGERFPEIGSNQAAE